MRRYVMRGPVSLLAAMVIPLALSAMLLPLRGHLANTNVALLLLVAVTLADQAGAALESSTRPAKAA
ncbi:hypothetical protein BOQ63_014775 [Streptomyces viridifaciens]|nr:hypothetical protein CP971_07900 [Streptomyces viridifaciens]UKZ05284.1 hypothetical protein BOQ63_014775 [Streptomyces viridifaciens]